MFTMHYHLNVFSLVLLLASSTTASLHLYPHQRLARGPVKQTEKFHNKDYGLIPISDQGTNSDTYEFTEDYDNWPAILKIVRKGSNADKEIKYAETVNLLLDHKSDDDFSYLILFNLRKDEPPLKPFHEWYMANKSIDAAKGLKTLRETIELHLVSYIKQYRLVYKDFHLRNIYCSETFEFIFPIDWGPPVGIFPGVVEIPEGTETAKQAEFKKHLEKTLPLLFNVGQLKVILEAYGRDLHS